MEVKFGLAIIMISLNIIEIYCKYVLNVNKNITSDMLYGESGCYPLNIERTSRYLATYYFKSAFKIVSKNGPKSGIIPPNFINNFFLSISLCGRLNHSSIGRR